MVAGSRSPVLRSSRCIGTGTQAPGAPRGINSLPRGGHRIAENPGNGALPLRSTDVYRDEGGYNTSDGPHGDSLPRPAGQTAPAARKLRRQIAAIEEAIDKEIGYNMKRPRGGSGLFYILRADSNVPSGTCRTGDTRYKTMRRIRFPIRRLSPGGRRWRRVAVFVLTVGMVVCVSMSQTPDTLGLLGVFLCGLALCFKGDLFGNRAITRRSKNDATTAKLLYTIGCVMCLGSLVIILLTALGW